MEPESREVLYKTLAILYRHAAEIAVLEYPRRMERRSIDLAVRLHDGRRLLVKLAGDLDTIPKTEIQELLALASSMNIPPVIVSERRGSEELLEGIAYEKAGIKVVSPATLESLLGGDEPLYIFESRDGYKVKIDPEKLRRRRIERSLSLGDLAHHLNTSRKAVYEYERGRLDPTIERAEKLVNLLGEDIVMPCDIFSARNLPEPRRVRAFDSRLEEETAAKLESAGFKVVHAKKTVIDLSGYMDETKVIFTVQHPREGRRVLYEKSVYMEKLAKTLNIGEKGVIVGDEATARELEKEGIRVIVADELPSLLKNLTGALKEQ